MNNRFKFRVWDAHKRKLLDEPAVYLSLNGHPHVFDSRGIPKPCPRTVSDGELWIVQFYTGVKDKNGREIYEGDLVNFSFRSGDNDFENETNQEVFFEEGIFYFGRKHYFAMNDANFSKPALEVVGNIFESGNKV